MVYEKNDLPFGNDQQINESKLSKI